MKRQTEERDSITDNGKKVEMEDRTATVPKSDAKEETKAVVSEGGLIKDDPTQCPQPLPMEQIEEDQNANHILLNQTSLELTSPSSPIEDQPPMEEEKKEDAAPLSPPNPIECATPRLNHSISSNLSTPVSDPSILDSKDMKDSKEATDSHDARNSPESSSSDSFLGGDTSVIQSSSLAHIRQLHTANRRQSILFDQSHTKPVAEVPRPDGVKSPSQVLMNTALVTLPTMLLQHLKTDVVKYTEADMLIERKRVALESKKESEEALAVMEEMLRKEKEKIVEVE